MIVAVLAVEAVLIFIAAAATKVSGDPTDPGYPLANGLAKALVALLGVAAILITVALFKGRWQMVLVGFLGLIAWGLGALLWLYAALSLAKPGSWWARSFYGQNKLMRAWGKFTPPPAWTKLCARCGYGFVTHVPTAVLCDRCRGVPQAADMIIPMGIGYLIGSSQNQPGGP